MASSTTSSLTPRRLSDEVAGQMLDTSAPRRRTGVDDASVVLVATLSPGRFVALAS